MKKQYGKYILLCLITIIVLGYILYYNLKQEEPSILTKYINEIKYNNINNFVIENSHVVIYATNNTKNINFENDLKKIIVKYNIGEKVLYYKNINYKDIKSKPYNKTNILVFYKNNKIKQTISTKNLTYNNLLELLKENEIINE
ncbi:MAG TPA: hypothetical protein PKY25_00045 [Bacilli bacterium]|nr:hypothetical protein [Bacilli bacterium]